MVRGCSSAAARSALLSDSLLLIGLVEGQVLAALCPGSKQGLHTDERHPRSVHAPPSPRRSRPCSRAGLPSPTLIPGPVHSRGRNQGRRPINGQGHPPPGKLRPPSVAKIRGTYSCSAHHQGTCAPSQYQQHAGQGAPSHEPATENQLDDCPISRCPSAVTNVSRPPRLRGQAWVSRTG